MSSQGDLIPMKVVGKDGVERTHYVKSDRGRHSIGTVIAAGAMIPVAAVGLSGCVINDSGTAPEPGPTSSNSVTESPRISEAPEEAPVEVQELANGEVLDDATALELRKNRPEDGTFAYKTKDGDWIKINRFEPLPEVAQKESQEKVNDVPVSTKDEEVTISGGKGAASQLEFGTGKKVVVINYGAVAFPSSSGGYAGPGWLAHGDIIADNGLLPVGQNLNSVLDQVNAMIAKKPNPSEWLVVVQKS